MNKLILLLAAVVIMSCQSQESPNEIDTPGIKTELSEPDYTLKCSWSGCFGRSIDFLEIRKDSANYRSYNPDNPDSTVIVKRIAWTSEKEIL